MCLMAFIRLKVIKKLEEVLHCLQKIYLNLKCGRWNSDNYQFEKQENWTITKINWHTHNKKPRFNTNIYREDEVLLPNNQKKQDTRKVI